jgi:hypothetical protein
MECGDLSPLWFALKTTHVFGQWKAAMNRRTPYVEQFYD